MLRFFAVCLVAIPATLIAQGSTKVFTGATLIDGTDRAPIPNATIVVRDGRIVGAGIMNPLTELPGVQRIDLTGKTVIPGLINAHGHVNGPADHVR